MLTQTPVVCEEKANTHKVLSSLFIILKSTGQLFFDAGDLI
jgi:hypothetical protein